MNSDREVQFRLYLLGAPQMQWGDQAFTPARRQVRALLYYLAATLEPLSRDRLAFLFWADLPDSAARNNLKRLLSTVRSALPERSILTASRDIVGLDRSRIWCDVEEFQRLAAGSDPGSWVEAVGLYHGPFLASFSLLNSPEYQTWHYQLQAQAELAYLDTLSRLVDSRRAAGDLDHAIDYAQRFLAVDELAEDIHRRLIELYGETGDRGAAARQFEACTLALERELGVRPLPETRAAYETAISARPTSPRPPHAWTVLPSLNLPLIGREDAWQALTTAYHRLKSGGVILISGEPGVGKSRLMQEFATACQSTVLTGNNPSSGHHVPYHAVSEALRQALSVPQRWQTI
ncbi:MAG: AAA family ATPase, partial [Anaerolineae bacterium]|nr:AAA family ATPase [Anaerolineae bacterium]